MSVAQKFNNLTPPQKRTTMAIAAITLVLGVSWALASVSEKKANRHPRAEKPEVTVVSPTRATGVEAFTAQMQILQKQQEEVKGKLERLMAERQRGHSSDDLPKDKEKPVDLHDPIPELTPQTSVFDAPVDKGVGLPPPPKVAVKPVVEPPAQPSPADQASAVDAAPAAKTIRVVAEDGEVTKEESEAKLNASQVSVKAPQKPESAFIPAGSMFTGVLLSGLDAPTSSVAQRNPTPVVVRIKREALLPNYASIDIRECFVMAAGYGQLSTERALMRAEVLTCVRHDGQVIENTLDAYIVGTDGKVGIPGRLVSKQGQMIAQSLLAGTLGGIGQALNRSRVPALNLNPASGHTLYQDESISSITQSGVAGGIGTATNMIAKFYLDMAKETFPVVEVPAGEVVTVIVTRGSNLPLKGSTNLQRVSAPQDPQNRANPQHKPASPSPLASLPAATSPAVAAAEAAIKATEPGAHGGSRATFQNGLGW
ncbi:TrbI/VirB10 family protein [Diaphorobacter sp. J5-51]|uniref:TrbI/VirB10 family protein n=1 Tax=Diaphorobacter sp. J5-51 TaxID=680496 RepID=UPI000642E2CA|nr:TrbI/VirB10 family protein [Diaphorobacter sp. J5-51]